MKKYIKMSTFPLHGRWEITQQEYQSMPSGVVGEGENIGTSLLQ